MKKTTLLVALTAVLLSGLNHKTFAQCSEIFISEYIDGWSNNRALELYNPTNNPIDLSAYSIKRYSNGSISAAADNTLQLSGIIQPKDVYVFVKDSSAGDFVWDDLYIKGDAYLGPDFNVNKTFFWNGNDAVVLFKGSNPIDAIGTPGEDPEVLNNAGGSSSPNYGWPIGGSVAWTKDHTLVRKPSIQEGDLSTIPPTSNSFIPSIEWDSLPANTFSSLGFHQCDCDSSAALFTCNPNLIIENPGISYYRFKHADTNTSNKDSIIWTISDSNSTNYYYDQLTLDHWFNIEGTYIIKLDFYNTATGNRCVATDTIVVDTVYCATPFILNETVCDSFYSWITNEFYKQSGTYYDTLPSQDTAISCLDTIQILHLTVNSLSKTIDTIVCGSYQLPSGGLISSSGTYLDTISGIGCDTIITANVTVKPYHYNFIFDTACNQYSSLTGNVYTQSGEYEEYRETADTCFFDSLFLVINNNTDTITDTACFSYIAPSGNVLFNSGIYYDTVVTGGTCDSIYVLDLVINPISTYYNEVSLIPGDSVIVGASVYFNPGFYDDTLSNIYGCDSIVTTEVKHEVVYITDTSACGSYQLPSGTIVYTSGSYSDTSNGGGIDTIQTTNVTIKPYFFTFVHDTVCNQYVSSQGYIYTQTGEYEEYRETADTCFYDSLFLVISNNMDTISDTTCFSYLTPSGNVLFTSGTYLDTVATGGVCDSIYVIELVVNQISTYNNTAAICQGDSVQVGTSVYYSPGFYDDTLSNSYGCDSIVTTEVIYNDSIVYFDTVTVCDSYTSPTGSVYFTSGNYIDTVLNGAGCDSIYNVNLTVVEGGAYFFFYQDSTGVIVLVDSSYGSNLGYQWSWGDGTVDSGVSNPTHTYSVHGSYEVCLDLIDVGNGCSYNYCDSLTVDSNGVLRGSFTLSVQSYEEFSGSTDIEENDLSEVTVYPNPANQMVWLESSDVIRKLEVFSANGQLVYSLNSINTSVASISVDDFNNGIYIIKIESDKGVITKRLIIQK